MSGLACFPGACVRRDLTVRYEGLERDKSALIAERDELREVLSNLVVWAEWHQRRRRHPTMDEPNTGALAAAVRILTPRTPHYICPRCGDAWTNFQAFDDHIHYGTLECEPAPDTSTSMSISKPASEPAPADSNVYSKPEPSTIAAGRACTTCGGDGRVLFGNSVWPCTNCRGGP